MIILTTLKRVLFWSYDRGTWPYDVMCVLILAFIFFSPNRMFRSATPMTKASDAAVFVARDELDQSGPQELTRQIRRRLSQKEGHEVSVSRIELELDDSGNVIGYRVWRK